MARNFNELLRQRWQEGKFLCVGLDSLHSRLPFCVRSGRHKEENILAFNKAIITATKDYVCAYKPNFAFYAAEGDAGLCALRFTAGLIQTLAPGVPIILDAKRADIGHTNQGYVTEAFDVYGADALTVNPYLGQEALKPFLDRPDKGIIVLCRTSNPGAGEFQDLVVGGKPLYQVVAQQVASEWNTNDNCSLVVGATAPAELAAVRSLVGDMPLLIPGIGKQGGDLAKTVMAGKTPSGKGMMINSSRGIIFASDGEDYAEVAGQKAKELNNKIVALLE